MASCLKKFSTLIIYCQATSWSMSSVLPSLICMASRRKHAQPGFLLQACTAWFPAADCKHVQFPAAKGTGYHASSHIITSYVLKRNRKQANKKESRALFLFGRAGPVGRWLFSFQCISDKTFLQIRINLPAGNHPSQTFPANQDAFPHWESSHRKSSRRKPYLPLKKACPAYETGRMHSERNSMRNHRKNEWKSKKWLNITGNK